MITTLLLDRDGTLIPDKHYLCDPAGVELLPDVGQGLAVLQRQGLRFFVVSNQSGIGRGYFTTEAVQACNERLAELLLAQGVGLVASLYCPHAPETSCPCRKPGLGMWHTLQHEYGLQAEHTAMAGDKIADMEFAFAAGLGLRILVGTGKGAATAALLGLEKPGFFPHPVGPAYPHLYIPSLAALPDVWPCL